MPKKGKSPKQPQEQQPVPPPRTWWPWLEVEQMASEHGLQAKDILVADEFVEGRLASNRQEWLYHVTEASIADAVSERAKASGSSSRKFQ